MRGTRVAAGLLADQVLGEPTVGPHPIALLGGALRALEDQLYEPACEPGIVLAGVGAAGGAAAGALLRRRVGGFAATTIATYVTSAGRALDEAAATVERSLRRDDLVAARLDVRALVGRDTSVLDGDEIVRAVVESVAENTVDAVVAPALWALVAGAPGAIAHRTVNTLDAHVGHRDDRYEDFGWASARLDDAMAWVPARATAGLVLAVRPRRAAAIAAAVRHDAPAHPSPNAGVAEAAFAGALGVRLGGDNRYGDVVERRAELGAGPPPSIDDIEAVCRLRRDVTAALGVGLVSLDVVALRRRRRRRRARADR